MAGFKEYQMLFQLNASVGGSFNSSFSSGQAAVQKLQAEINSLNKTQSDISSYQKQQAAVDKTKQKLELYQTQLANLQNAEASTSKEEAELANAIAAKEHQIQSTTDKLDQQNAALSETGQALREAGVDTSDLAGETARLEAESAALKKTQMEEAESSNALGDALAGAAAAMEAIGAAKALEAVYGALKDCSQAAAEFETAMASVKRTVGGDDAFIADLGDSFKELSTEMPITASELAEIASTAGQLGIAQENVEGFTTVMAQLATTTDLTADNAATMLAQFANITGTTEYDRLGATVAALGDSTATTASKVVEMSQGMAAAASIAGMSETDILAISAAVGSLGIESQAGSTAMSQLITTLYKATETGDQLEDFASVAGMTASEFSSAWAGDPVTALNAFIQGLNDTERNGKSAMVILDELGISNVRQTKAILGLASAGDLLSNTISQANNAWAENSALAEKAGVMYGTTEAKLTMMQNAANNVSIAVGDALNPAVSAAADMLTGLLQPIAEFISENPALVQGVTAFVGVLGAGTVALAAFTAKAKLAAAASALLGSSMPVLGTILAVAGGIGVLVAGISALSGADEEATVSLAELNAEYNDLVKTIDDNSAFVEQIDNFTRLTNETENLKRLMSGDFSTDVEFTGVAKNELTNADFGAEGGDVTYMAAAGNTLNPEDFGISNQTLEYICEFKPKNAEEVLQKAKDIGAEIVSTDQDLEAARKKLQEMKDSAAEVEEKLNGTKKKKEKAALQEQLEELNKGITEQQTAVETLEKKQATLKSQYELTASAAAELTGKEAELAAAKKAVIENSGGLITASANEAEALTEEAQAAKEFTEAQEALNKAKLAQMQLDAMDSIGKQAVSYAKNADAYKKATDRAKEAADNINNMTDTASLKEHLQGIVDEVGRLQSTINEETGDFFDWDDAAVKAYREEFTLLAKSATGLDLDPESYYAMGNALSLVSSKAETAETATVNLGKEIENANADAKTAESAMNDYVDAVVSMIESGFDAGQAEQFMRTELGKAGYEGSVADEIMAKVNQTLDEHAKTAEEAANADRDLADATDGLNEATGNHERAIDDIIKDITDLGEAYDEAYKAAYASMNGQFDLFEEASQTKHLSKGDNEKAVKGYENALESQKKFIEDYKANYQKASEAGLDEGLLAQLADGSEQSAQQLANLANASKEEIDTLNSKYAELQASKEEFASTVADIETNFSSTMEALQSELAGTVQAMDFSTEAGANAAASLQAFCDMASKYETRVYNAYKKIANKAKQALKFNPTDAGYASGTNFATPGIHLVGEEGPELVNFRGGETVLDAEKTAAALAATPAIRARTSSDAPEGGGGTYNVTVSCQVDAAGVDADEVVSRITGSLQEKIVDVLEDIESDRKRRDYA